MVWETKLHSFLDTQFVIEGCAPFRYDRNCRGDGILLFIREDITAIMISTTHSNNFEWIFRWAEFSYRRFQIRDQRKKRKLSLRISRWNSKMSWLLSQWFYAIFLAVLNKHAPVKKRYIKANQTSFIVKELNQTIVVRSKLCNKFLKFKNWRKKRLAYNS